MPQTDESDSAVGRSARNIVTDSLIEELRSLVDGERDTVFDIWKSLRADPDATIQLFQFVFKPIMQRALKRSVQILPDLREITLMQMKEPSKDQPKEDDPIPPNIRKRWDPWIKDVLSRPGWEEEEDDLRAALEFWRERPKVDGTIYFKLPIGPDPEDRSENPRMIVKPVRMDAIGTEMLWTSQSRRKLSDTPTSMRPVNRPKKMAVKVSRRRSLLMSG